VRHRRIVDGDGDDLVVDALRAARDLDDRREPGREILGERDVVERMPAEKRARDARLLAPPALL
jgi:hypothetical protein